MKNLNYLKKALLTAFSFACCLFSSQVSNATHLAGGDITYQHIAGNNYKIILTLYRDCSGSGMQQNYNVSIASASCALNQNLQVSQEAGTGQEITLPCASGGTTCANPPGTSFGVRKYVYSNTVILPAACADWVFSWSLCCRNCNTITTTVHGNCGGMTTDPLSNIYLESRLNNLDVSDNNSPIFSVNPVTSLCLGQSFKFNNGVVDPDGDLLVYSLVGSAVAPGTTVTYQPNHSATNPLISLPPISIDAATGDLNMTPQQIEVGVMAVKIDEYRAGILIGSVTRDLQFTVVSCINSLPAATGINGTAIFDTIICPGTNLCFYIFTSDADNGQFISLSTNNAIPGSVFNNSGGALPTGSFCWTPTQADARMTPWTFIAKVRDDACPTNGLQAYSFNILIPFISPTSVVDDATGSIDMTVTGNTGSYTYLWSTSATTEDVTGLAPGIYTLTICEANGCCITTQDTIEAIVNCAITVGSQHHNASCGTVCDGWLHLIPHGTGPYQYNWSTGQTTQNISNLCGGSYTCTVTDANGCTHKCVYTIKQPASLVVNCSASNTCNGASLGSASATVTGGTPPFRYVWDNGDTTATITGLCKATYCVVVTDANSCTGTCCASVNSYQAIGIAVKTVNATSLTSCDGKYSVSAGGGTGPYTFAWSTGAVATGVTSDSITSLCPGTYTVTITDVNGCFRKCIKIIGPSAVRFSFDHVINITRQAGVDGEIVDATLKATVIPNPFNNDFIIQTGSDEAMQIHIYNMSGALVKEYDNVLPSERIGAGLSGGLYIMEIQQAGEVVYQRISKQNQ